MYLPLLIPLFPHKTSSYCLASFHFTLELFLQGRFSGIRLPRLLSRNVLICPSQMKDSFARYRILCWRFFLFLFFSTCSTLDTASGLQSVWWEIWWSFWGSLICDKLFLSSCFQDSLFILGFQKLIIMGLNMGGFVFLLLGVPWASVCLYLCISSNLGSFQHLLVQILSLPLSFSLFSF